MRKIMTIVLLGLLAQIVQAQITIGGSIYGGGNKGDVSGNSTVDVHAGELGKVYGGARMANVGGRAFVNIDGRKATGNIFITQVYGGNDISGNIGTSTVPTELEEATENGIDNTWNAFVRTSASPKLKDSGIDSLRIIIGSLFGGGNGDYYYTSTTSGGQVTHSIYLKEGDTTPIATKVTDEGELGFVKPELGKTYLELKGGCIAHAYGGGNNVTVTGNTTICIDNQGSVLDDVLTAAEKAPAAFATLAAKLDLSTFQSNVNLLEYNFARVFGGNNKADMPIMPKWVLKKGVIRDLYSGGNQGRMVYSNGILLEIPENSEISAYNVYGGCRMADVFPSENSEGRVYKETTNPEGYSFPAVFAARTLVRGGNITNVYGGNDITGKVYGGNAVGVYTSIQGDLYGGGNGSYAYTDNPELAKFDQYKDFYYPKTVGGTTMSSVAALDARRPHAEQVSVRVAGKVVKTGNDSIIIPTIVHGAIYLGGNSATLKPKAGAVKPTVELKIGSYVISDTVFLGNNGAHMVDEDLLKLYAGSVKVNGTDYDFSEMDLKNDAATFAAYMDGASLGIMPTVVFDDKERGDPATYREYTTYFGSFYCGGNVGSMTKTGCEVIDFNHQVVIYDKLVGGCNNAIVPAGTYNARYEGGLIGSPDPTTGNRLQLNLSGLKIKPMTWRPTPLTTKTYPFNNLEWHTVNSNGEEDVIDLSTATTGKASAADLNRRYEGGNVFGGCYNSGLVKGNVVINIDATIIDRDSLFDTVAEDAVGEAIYYKNKEYNITKRRSGVIIGQQGMDVLGRALSVFGGGKGPDTEIWGNTTINLNKGYIFQVFGGSAEGVIGKPNDGSGTSITFNGKTFNYNDKYSCTVNLKGTKAGLSMQSPTSEDMAEAGFIYGGGFKGPVCGNTVVNLGNGRVFNSFGGSCNADILGHTETYVGRNTSDDNDTGFPWIRDIVYGGNDLGGRILGSADFADRVSDFAKDKVYPKTTDNTATATTKVTTAAAYMEYQQGRADAIFGGCYGTYDYKSEKFRDYFYANGTPKPGFSKPFLDNAFVNFRPSYTNENNVVKKVYGSGEGVQKESARDSLQMRSYVLIDIPQEEDTYEKYYKDMQVFGGGAFCGLGMKSSRAETELDSSYDLTKVSAVIDLMRGKINTAFGGSFEEGVTRRSVVNVPRGSTIKIDSIFGGAYGNDPNVPCDVYEAHVNYHSENAIVQKIFGGNNHADRTLYGHINIDVPVYTGEVENGIRYQATVFGAGSGEDTWSQYTEINLLDGAQVYEAYGGGNNGTVLNWESMRKWRKTEGAALDLSLPGYENTTATYQDEDGEDFHLDYGLESPLAHAVSLDGKKYNTNVHIHRGAVVGNYAYGGGLGDKATVSGTAYIDLLGGVVAKDIYAAGTKGAIFDLHGAKDFTAGATAYIEGGKCRNVFGGGWKGDVGYHDTLTVATTTDILGETKVVIGIRKDQATLPDGYGFYKGVPSIERNAYAGGEGGAVFGNASLVLNNGYIGYRFFTETPTENFPYYTDGGGYYQEKINDETYYVEGKYAGDDRLKDCGNVFGGGYDVRSSVDSTSVTMYGGVVRNSMHGGGEIATIGRGAATENGAIRTVTHIYKPGSTFIDIYNGHVKRNVFGGGKGYNMWGYGQQGTLYTDGYVFGKTEVHVHGGEVGTKEGVDDGYGNVFGGGDIGYVYSGSYFTGTHTEGTGSPGNYYYKDAAGNLTEDCSVVVSPYLQIKPGGETVTYGGKTYGPYDYVPTGYLNTLGKKPKGSSTWPADWSNLITEDASGERGVIIYNAVFGGGNVSSNSDTQYANATTIYGNTTAVLNDVYHRDFITIGTEHVGGLYGGGNLSLVNGYRELNITNYGTAYYALETKIPLEDYHDLSSRERAYFQLKYQCKTNVTFPDGSTYSTTDAPISEEEYLELVEKYGNLAVGAFEPYGFCSIYAGRLLNTIQRADFCGVFGSRMVLQGAKDRVADVGEDVDYTINRVGELSLNLGHSVISSDTGEDATHGNYFGIYSIVNHMGNLTSDVKFGTTYRNGDGDAVSGTTYYDYKKSSYLTGNPSLTRNNGSSYNQVALAAGVYLELTTENSTEDHKDYGYITGVVELDLINVKKESVGGGFVYAKNEHRVPKYFPNKKNVLLSSYNTRTGDEARTNKRYYYTNENLPTGAEAVGAEVISGDDSHVFQTMAWQTSGNFIHPSKKIVDDCYPTNNAYIIGSDNYSEAHYWYVKGEVYIYDQKVSAYTGSANAYSKTVHLPLTITAASHGRLQLLNVKPNLYAYKMPDPTDDTKPAVKIGSAMKGDKVVDKVWVNNENDGYGLNEVVTWWDWHQMSPKDRQYFVANTYVNCVTCTIDGTEYEAGSYVLDDTDYAGFKTSFESGGVVLKDINGDNVTDLKTVFRTSNNIGHDTGYLLTFNMDSPDIWNDYYTMILSSTPQTDKMRESAYLKALEDATSEAAKQAIRDTWRQGPTYTPVEGGIYGKHAIQVGHIITHDTYTSNKTTKANDPDAATVEPAYVATEAVSYVYNSTPKTTNAGTAIPESEFNGLDATTKQLFAPAYVCTQTVKLAEKAYLGYGELLTADSIAKLKLNYPTLATDIQNAMTQAYICSEEGNYGGQQFDVGTNYNALTTWCALPKSDRIDAQNHDKFTFNYDALDLLKPMDYLQVNVNVPKVENPTHEETQAAYKSPYTNIVGVEYQAVFKATTGKTTYSYPAGTTEGGVSYPAGTLADGQGISQDIFEAAVRNDKRHYTKVTTTETNEIVYFATKNFVYNGVPYAVGQVIDDAKVYSNNLDATEPITFSNTGVHYYCYENYESGNKGDVINETEFGNLQNDQKYFVIQGKEPTETTTFYVSGESDIKDVSQKRVYTVVYQYTYYEDEDDGSVKMTNELHVINIHLEMESGAPTIGQLNPPGTVLPNTAVGLTRPDVKPGLFEVITNGWELFLTEDDAIHHRNGVTFVNNETPVYWYQNQENFVAFYSQTWQFGKTYSNYVPLSVANYHDLDAVMKDKEHHYYVDRSDVLRPCKIYIDNRDCTSDAEKSELDLLKDFYDLSVLSGSPAEGTTLYGHSLMDSHVRGGNNLEFILRSDVQPKKYTDWQPIGGGDSDPCFSGNLHGDGYTISGLNNSLFGKLCGNVYNLGVTGSFSSAGIADSGEGYMENCWINTTATSGFAADTYPVFGNPSRDASDGRGPIQVVNCYYPESNAYHLPTTATTHGQARMMPDKAFYNGTVAYNLNGFYLRKRFYDSGSTAATSALNGSAVTYKYLPLGADGTLPEEMSTARYPASYALYIPERHDESPAERSPLGYVEHRFYDGDFIYAGGSIPASNNVRMRTVTTTDGNDNTVSKNYYTPIWPDDYLFFGQRLNYGYVEGSSHQDVPTVISRSGERVATGDNANRVFRAPAYFGSATMDAAHFNADAVFAATKKEAPDTIAYKGLTAIDFTGGNGDVSGGYLYELQGTKFFPPLLDENGLTGFKNVDLTRNLLVYTATPSSSTESTDPVTAAQKTANVVSTYLPDEAYVETNDTYHTVPVWDSHSDAVRGHWVQLSGSNYVAIRDHMLVDKQDFNCPISYSFDTDKRMWYQRTPDNYVDIAWSGSPAVRTTKGWEGISLPFSAAVVTTQTKGELTHFYNTSVLNGATAETIALGNTGHEYWLRYFSGIAGTDGTTVKANLTYPAAATSTVPGGFEIVDKEVTNTFLWDYYYDASPDGHSHQDLNDDTYQTYYNSTRTYNNYPLLTRGMPYIIGFPGATYYEFDLSGKFLPKTTADPNPGKLDAQVITFASAPTTSGAVLTIGVSDTETATGVTPSGSSYTFHPSYMNTVVDTDGGFVLTATGDSYKKTTAATNVAAFRPYFTGATSGAPAATRSIVFVNEGSQNFEPYMPHDSGDDTGSLSFATGRHKIIVTSMLKTAADVIIVNTTGVTIATFNIEPGQTIETRIPNSGIYIVRAAGGHYTKKIAVK